MRISSTENSASLGSAFNLRGVETRFGLLGVKTVKVDDAKVKYPTIGQTETKGIFTLSSSSSESYRYVGIDYEIQGSVDLEAASLSGSGAIAGSQTLRQLATSNALGLSLERSYGQETLVSRDFEDEPKSYLDDGDLSSFEAIYGTHYVSAVERVHRLNIRVTTSSMDRSEFNRIAANIKTQVDVIGVADLQQQLEVMRYLKTESKQFNLAVNIDSAVGYFPASGKIVPTKTESLDQVLQETLNTWNGLERKDGGIGGYYLRPAIPAFASSDAYLTGLGPLVGSSYQAIRAFDLAEKILNGQDAFFSWIPTTVKTDLLQYQENLTIYIRKIRSLISTRKKAVRNGVTNFSEVDPIYENCPQFDWPSLEVEVIPAETVQGKYQGYYRVYATYQGTQINLPSSAVVSVRPSGDFEGTATLDTGMMASKYGTVYYCLTYLDRDQFRRFGCDIYVGDTPIPALRQGLVLSDSGKKRTWQLRP